MMAADFIEDLYVGVLLTLVVVIMARNLKVCIGFYIGHAFLLSCIYLWYAHQTGSLMMLLWFSTTVASQVLLIPFAPGGLFYTVKRYQPRETAPIIPFGLSVVFIAILAAGSWGFFHYVIDFVAPKAEALQEPSRSNLAIAFTVFSLGVYTLLTRRDTIKTVMALCILGNAIDLTLVDLTPGMAETAALGILTDVIISVFILLYIGRMLYVRYGVTDTMKLSELRY